MSERKNAGTRNRNRDAGSSSGTSASSSSSSDNSGATGQLDSDGSGAPVVGSGAVDQGAGGGETKSAVGTDDSGRSSVGSGGGDEGAGTGARTTSDSGGGSDLTPTGRVKRKYGKRGSETEGTTEDGAPRVIHPSRLRGGKRKAKRDYTESFAKGFKVLYEMPKYAGYGNHWPISDDDAELLGGKLNDVVLALPKGTANKLAEFFDKYVNPYIPVASLVTATYLITEPRIAVTRQLMAEARVQRDRQSSATGSPTAPAGSAASNGEMHEGAEGSTTSRTGGEGVSDEAIGGRFARDV